MVDRRQSLSPRFDNVPDCYSDVLVVLARVWLRGLAPAYVEQRLSGGHTGHRWGGLLAADACQRAAEKVGGNYYTFISQLESGRGRIPPDRYLVWAEVLGVEPKFFVRNLLRSYDPVTYSILFRKSKPQR